jgi:hypothetical protein
MRYSLNHSTGVMTQLGSKSMKHLRTLLRYIEVGPRGPSLHRRVRDRCRATQIEERAITENMLTWRSQSLSILIDRAITRWNCMRPAACAWDAPMASEPRQMVFSHWLGFSGAWGLTAFSAAPRGVQLVVLDRKGTQPAPSSSRARPWTDTSEAFP